MKGISIKLTIFVILAGIVFSSCTDREYSRPDHVQLKTILEKHQKWLKNEEGGESANLRGANLEGVNLVEANLRGANLEGVNLRRADLVGADLVWADLEESNLEGANLRGTYLFGANLTDTKGVIGFYLGKHFGYAWKNKENQIIVKIGCKEAEIGEIIKQAKGLGKKFGYTNTEVNLYVRVLKAIKDEGLKSE